MSKIKDVFKDYKEDNNLINAEIENVNLFKKSKKIEIELKLDEQVKIDDISSFEEYLKERFQIEKACLIIQTSTKGEKLLNLKDDWNDIVRYLSKNYPLCKAILGTSTVEINGKIITVSLKTKSSDFLHSYEVDKEIERVVLNLYGEKCKVEYKEDISEDILKKQEQYLENLEKEACEDLMNEIKLQEENAKEVVQNEQNENANEIEGKHSLILGRSSKIKEQIVKISDLSTDYGRVALEGKVISVDSRELKNGKTLAQFNLYDGTSTITCKSFVPEEKAKDVMRKTKKCKKS